MADRKPFVFKKPDDRDMAAAIEKIAESHKEMPFIPADKLKHFKMDVEYDGSTAEKKHREDEEKGRTENDEKTGSDETGKKKDTHEPSKSAEESDRGSSDAIKPVKQPEDSYTIDRTRLRNDLYSRDLNKTIIAAVKIRSTAVMSASSVTCIKIKDHFSDGINIYEPEEETFVFAVEGTDKAPAVEELKALKDELMMKGISSAYNVKSGKYFNDPEDMLKALYDDLDMFSRGEDPYAACTLADKEDKEKKTSLTAGIKLEKNIADQLPADIPANGADEKQIQNALAQEAGKSAEQPVNDKAETSDIQSDTPDIRKILLIDSENVSLSWKDLLSDDPSEELVVLYTDHTPKISYDEMPALLGHRCRVRFEKVLHGEVKSNALDFQLVSLLGYLIRENGDLEYAIVSRDKGYDPVVDYWKGKGVNIYRLSMVNRQLPAGTTAFTSLSESERQAVRDACTNMEEKMFKTPTAAAGAGAGGKKLDRMIWLQKKIPGRKKDVYECILKILEARDVSDEGMIHADFIDLFGAKGQMLFDKIKKGKGFAEYSEI